MEDEDNNTIKTIAIVLSIVLGLATIGLLIYKSISNNTIKKNNTTTVTKAIKDDPMASLDNYSNTISKNTEELSNPIIYDNTIKRIDLYVTKKCRKTGDNVTINSNGYKVQYNCYKELSKGEWEIKGKIDDNIDFIYSTVNPTYNINYYRINNYIIKTVASKTNASIYIVIYDSSTGEEIDTLRSLITPYSYDTNNNKYNSNIYIKKGVMYYHKALNASINEDYKETTHECIIQKIDFNKNIQQEELLKYACNYVVEN